MTYNICLAAHMYEKSLTCLALFIKNAFLTQGLAQTGLNSSIIYAYIHVWIFHLKENMKTEKANTRKIMQNLYTYKYIQVYAFSQTKYIYLPIISIYSTTRASSLVHCTIHMYLNSTHIFHSLVQFFRYNTKIKRMRKEK